MPEQTSELQGVIDAINYATSQIGNAIGAYGDALKAEIEAENIATGAGLSTAAAADAIVAGKLLGAQSALIDGSISLTKSGAALIAGDKLGAIDEALNGATSIYTGAAGAATGAELGLLLGGPVGAAVGAVLGYASASLIGRSDYNFLKTLTSYIYFGKGFSWTPANWARGFLPTIFFDPLVVNLTGNGAPNLTNVDSSTTTFDYFGNGFKTQTGWIGAGSGLLAYDPSGTGNITAANLLGSPTQSGVDALRALDSNGDGVINSSDPAYASLGVWIDANGDGVSQPGEFQSLASLGITSINLNFATTGNLTVNDNGNQILSTASYSLSNGNAGSISEVNFQVNTTNSTFTPPAGFTLDPATAALPELKGSGNVLDLATAMTLDPKLKAMVQAIVAMIRSGVTVDQLLGSYNAAHTGNIRTTYDTAVLQTLTFGGFSEYFTDAAGAVHGPIQEPSYTVPIPDSAYAPGYFEQLMAEWASVSSYGYVSTPFAGGDPFNEQPYSLSGSSGLAVSQDTSGADAVGVSGGGLIAPLGFHAAEIVVSFYGLSNIPQSVLDYGPSDLQFDIALQNLAAGLATRFFAQVAGLSTTDTTGTYAGLASNLYYDPTTDTLVGDGVSLFTQELALDGITNSSNANDVAGWIENNIKFINSIDPQHTALWNAIRSIAGNQNGVIQTSVEYLVSSYLYNSGHYATPVGTKDIAPASVTINAPSPVNSIDTGTAGPDVYTHSSADGFLEISDASGGNELAFQGDETLASATFSFGDPARTSLVINFADGNGVKIDNFFAVDGTSNFGTITFPDGPAVTALQALNYALETETAGGANVVAGFSSGDTLVANAGNDVLIGVTSTSAGTYVANSDTFYAGTGNDIIIPGYGRNNTYVYSLGDGNLAIADFGTSAGYSSIALGNDITASNTLEFGAGISASDIKISAAGANAAALNTLFSANVAELAGNAAAQSAQVFLLNANNNVGVLASSLVIQVAGGGTIVLPGGPDILKEIDFNDGTRLTEAQIAQVYVNAQEAQNATIVYGSTLSSTFTGGSGNQTFVGAGLNDVFIAGSAPDPVTGASSIETFEGSGTFQIALGSDSVVIAGASGVIQFGSGITPQNLVASQTSNGQDVILSISGTTQTVTLSSQLLEGQNYTVQFADGSSLSANELLGRSIANAESNGAPVIYGGDYSFSTLHGMGNTVGNTLTAGAGDVTLNSNGFSYTLVAGSGNDTLIAGSGNTDPIHLGPSTIFDIGRYNSNYNLVFAPSQDGGLNYILNDVLNLGSGIDSSQVSLTLGSNGSDLILSVAGTNETVTLQNFESYAAFSNYNQNQFTINFSNGTSWTKQDIYYELSRNLYVFHAGVGAQTVDFQTQFPQNGKIDTVSFGITINPASLTFFADSAGDLVISAGGGDQLTVVNGLGLVQSIGSGAIRYNFDAFDSGTDGEVFGSAIYWGVNSSTPINTSALTSGTLTGDASAQFFDAKGLVHNIVGGGGTDQITYHQGYGLITIDETDTTGVASSELFINDTNLLYGGGSSSYGGGSSSYGGGSSSYGGGTSSYGGGSSGYGGGSGSYGLTGLDPAAVGVVADSAGDVTLYLGSGDQITLQGQLSTSTGAAHGVGEIVFSDGTIWTNANILAAIASGVGNGLIPNQAPVIAAGTTMATGTLIEQANAPAPAVNSVSGTIGFTDADLTDTHIATVTGVTATGVTAGLPIDATLLSLLSMSGLTEEMGAISGIVAWAFVAPNSDFAYLAQGETVTLNYAVQIADDRGATATQNVTVTVVGTNDNPIISTATTTATGAITEQINTTGSSALDTATGTIGFTDPNVDDTHTATITGVTASGATAGLPGSSALLAWLSAGTLAEQADATPGSVGWSFSAAESNFDYLAQGEKLTLNYTVQIADNHGGTVSQNVVVTVTGTNDAPVTTLMNTQTARLNTATAIYGISVADPDDGATETVTLTSLHGNLSAAAASGATVTGAGTKALTIAGPPASVNATLAGLTYTSAVSGSDTITVVTSDGIASNTQTIAVTVNTTVDHAPVVNTATTIASGAINELANTTGATATDKVSGSIGFSDADLTDKHTLVVSSVTTSGVITGLPATATLLTWLQSGTINEELSSAPGSAGWTFSAADKSFDYLAAGETATLTYTVKLADNHGGSTTQNVTITVTGTNDLPVIATGTTATGAITERASLTGSTLADTASGTIKFGDADLHDSHTASIAGVTASGVTTGLASISSATLQSWLALGALTNSAGSAALGSVGWSFSATDGNFDYLAAGEKLILTYVVQIGDNFGGTVNQNVVITVTGTNDAPVIVPATTIAFGAITEQAEPTSPTALNVVTGSIGFADADLSDKHTLKITSVTSSGITSGLPAAATLLSYLKTGTIAEESGASPGSAAWTFSAPDTSFEYLAVGETTTLSYLVTLSDTHGGSITQNVTITVTGTNDAPVIASGTTSTGAITERANLTGSTLADTASGTIKFSDVNTSDTHSATIAGVTASGVTTGLGSISNATLQSWLSLGVLTNNTASVAGSLGWSFSATDGNFDYLATGEKLILTYVMQIADNHGGTVNQNVVITVTGTNDAPVAIGHSGFTTDNQTPLTITAATLLAVATDPDLSDTLSLKSVQGALGGTVALVNGNAVFTPTPTAIGTASFTYTVADNHGGTSTATINLTTTLHDIVAAAGTTVTGTVAPSLIDGRAGNDVLHAGSAGDTLVGGPGDTLYGGAGIDTFAFHTGFGLDSLYNFTSTGTKHDILQVDSNIFADWAHLLGATKQVGTDLQITLDPTDILTLKNVALANFTSADAHFV